MLLAGFISTVIGCQLPGPGSIYIKQDLKFRAPGRIGDTVTAKATVVEIIEEKNRVILETTCTNQEGIILLDGQAIVSPPNPGKRENKPGFFSMPLDGTQFSTPLRGCSV